MDDLISRQAAIDAIGEKSDEIFKTKQKGATYPHDDFFQGMAYAENVVKRLPSAQPEIVRCKDCKYWNNGSCECREHAVNSQDYYVGDMETEAEHFCGYAEMREVTT